MSRAQAIALLGGLCWCPGARGETAKAEAVERIVELVEEGRHPVVHLRISGQPLRGRLVGADGDGFSVEFMGSEFPRAWDSLDAKAFYRIAKKFLSAEGEDGLILAELAIQAGLEDEAAELLRDRADDPRANELSRSLGSKEEKRPPVKIDIDKLLGTTKAKRRAAPGRVKAGLRTDRPRILMTRERLNWLRTAKRSSGDYARLKGYVRAPDGYTTARAYATVYLIDGDETAGRKAVDMVMKGQVRRGRITDLNRSFPSMSEAALVYDWCHPLLSDEEKKSIVDWLNLEYDAMKDQYASAPAHNYMMGAAHAFTFAGYATHPENPRAQEMIRNGVKQRFEGRILPALVGPNAGGAWAEGEGYAYTTVPDVTELVECVLSCEGKSYYEKAKLFLLQRLAYSLFCNLPGTYPNVVRRLWIRGDGRLGGHPQAEMHARLMLTRAYAGTDTAAYAQAFNFEKGADEAPYRSGCVHDVLWRDGSLPSKPLQGYKLSHHARGMGVVLMKSDWTADATMVSFICGDYESGHQHQDSGSFQIYRRDYLAVDAGQYVGTLNAYARSFYIRTIAHNTVVLEPGEGKIRVRGGEGIDDGGHAWRGGERHLETGNILAYDARRAYTYVCGDVTPAFGGRVKRHLRHLLFVRPHTVVVFDVFAADPARGKVFLLHSHVEPQVSGSSFLIRNGEGKLYGWTVLPARAQSKVVKGYAVAGKRFPPGSSRDRDVNEFRLELRPRADPGQVVFLHVFRTARASEGPPPAPRRIVEGPNVGVAFEGFEVRFSSTGMPGGLLTLAGEERTLSPRVRPEEE